MSAAAVRPPVPASPWRVPIRAAILAGLVGLVVVTLLQVPHRWHWPAVWARRGDLADGLLMTVWLSAGAMVVGLGLGAGGCLLRISRFDALRFTGTCYVELIRNTPLLVQLYIAYFCVFPALRYDSPPVTGIVALGVFSGAYVTEILRAGVESVDRGQTEAALSLGLTRAQALLYVVGPQAIRRVIPPLTGQFVSLVKDSSLLSTISIGELTWMARSNAASDYRYFEFYIALALLYLAITFPLSRLSVWLERRLAREGRDAR